MGDLDEERWVSDAPRFAPAELTSARPLPAVACGACGSADTECVHHASAGSIIGWWCETEHRCRACGKFTGSEETYES